MADKGKKFNAKKETAQNEEYYGIKIFRFYIVRPFPFPLLHIPHSLPTLQKCTRCSAEITFKTDPKNADYICEHGAKRNFEPTTAAASYVPNAAEDDSDAAESDVEDPMKALEESQAAAKRQMEDEDQLADLRQRNARLERGDVDMAEVLRVRHEARDKAEEERRRREAEEDEEVVKQYFYKVKKGGAGLESIKEDADKLKEKPAGVGLGDGYGSSDDEEEKSEEPAATVTVKRTPLPSASGTTASEPTVQDLLAAKGIALPTSSKPAAPSSTSAKPSMLGIKRKDGASGLGVKLVKKKKLV